jgi:hypothetical protein
MEAKQLTRNDADTHRLALRRIEKREHRFAEAYCNGDVTLTDEEWEARDANTKRQIAKILGYQPIGLFINGDPRGYALKVQSENAGDLPQDWGGYGLIAPDR